MHRAYLVSRGAHLAGLPDDGVRDALSAECKCGNVLGSMTHSTTAPCLLAAAPRLPGISGVSCFVITTVHASVQLMFPIPFSSSSHPRPVRGFTDAFASAVCASARDVYPQLHTPQLPKEHVRTRTCRSRHGSGGEQDTTSGYAHFGQCELRHLRHSEECKKDEAIVQCVFFMLRVGSLKDTAPQSITLEVVVRDS